MGGSDPETVARSILLNRLNKRPYTRAELSQLLVERGVPREVAEAVLDRFCEVGLVDDAAFATSWVESRGGRAGRSRRRLQLELQRRRVPQEARSAALSGYGDDSEYAAALDFARRRWISGSGLALEIRHRRVFAALQRRGFAYPVCQSVLRELSVDFDSEPDDD